MRFGAKFISQQAINAHKSHDRQLKVMVVSRDTVIWMPRCRNEGLTASCFQKTMFDRESKGKNTFQRRTVDITFLGLADDHYDKHDTTFRSAIFSEM